jgi:hypothetical protein
MSSHHRDKSQELQQERFLCTLARLKRLRNLTRGVRTFRLIPLRFTNRQPDPPPKKKATDIQRIFVASCTRPTTGGSVERARLRVRRVRRDASIVLGRLALRKRHGTKRNVTERNGRARTKDEGSVENKTRRGVLVNKERALAPRRREDGEIRPET